MRSMNSETASSLSPSSGRRSNTSSPTAPSGARLVTSTRSSGAAPSQLTTASPSITPRCSALSKHKSAGPKAANARPRASAAVSPTKRPSFASPSARAMRRHEASMSLALRRSMNHTPPQNDFSCVSAKRRARRVLPYPGPAATVTKRSSPRRRSSRFNSWARPMNGVGSKSCATFRAYAKIVRAVSAPLVASRAWRAVRACGP